MNNLFSDCHVGNSQVFTKPSYADPLFCRSLRPETEHSGSCFAINSIACATSVSVGFPRKFRCFGRAKIGARAKKKEVGGGEEKRKR